MKRINDLLEPKHVVTVVASVHGIEEAPKVSVAAARAVQSKVERRKIKASMARFQFENTT